MIIVCDVIFLLKVGLSKVVFGFNKDDFGLYFRWGFIFFLCIEFYYFCIIMGIFVFLLFYVNKKLLFIGLFSVNDI